MARPPFRRHRRQSATPAKRAPWQRGLRNIFLLVLGITLYEFAAHGEVRWPGQVASQVGEVLGRDDAGWQQARVVLEQQGARREGDPTPAFDLRGRVVRCGDGDSLSLLDNAGQQHTIRLYGIDTPELSQAYGREAKGILERLVLQKDVGVVVVDVDNYQREVGTVYADSLNVNRAMVETGYAWWYRFHAPHERDLEHAEREARQQSLGLWSQQSPQPPWDWRRAHRN